MTDFIKEYWLGFLFAGVSGGLTWLFRKMYKLLVRDNEEWKAKVVTDMEEQKLIKAGLLSILHDRLYQACRYYIKQGCCPVDDLKNLEHLYKGYHDIGGNGTCEELYKRCRQLPIEKG